MGRPEHALADLLEAHYAGDAAAFLELQERLRAELTPYFVGHARLIAPIPPQELVRRTIGVIAQLASDREEYKTHRTRFDEWWEILPRDELDKCLMQLHYDGRDAAFEEIYRYWLRPLTQRIGDKLGKKMARRGAYTRQLAENMACQVLFRVYETRDKLGGRFDTSRSFRTWIRAVADNYVKDYFRRESARATTSLPDDEAPDAPSSNLDVATQVVHREVLSAAMEIPEFRERLKYGSGGAPDTSPSVSQTRFFRAKEKFLKRFGNFREEG